jgi:hypothetical protein
MMMRMRMNHPLDFVWVAPTISLLATLGLSEVRRVPCSGNTAPSSADADRVKLRRWQVHRRMGPSWMMVPEIGCLEAVDVNP